MRKYKYSRFGSVIKKERFSLLAQYRNRLLKAGKPFDSDYALILDSDVLFPNNIIEQYLKYMRENIAMITPNILQNIKCKMFNKNKDSYYDCLALRDNKKREGMVWVCNPSKFYGEGPSYCIRLAIRHDGPA